MHWVVCQVNNHGESKTRQKTNVSMPVCTVTGRWIKSVKSRFQQSSDRTSNDFGDGIISCYEARPSLRLLMINWLESSQTKKWHTRLITNEMVITTSATHEDKNHISADVCNSSLRANTLIWTILTAVQVPPADWPGVSSSNHELRCIYT